MLARPLALAALLCAAAALPAQAQDDADPNARPLYDLPDPRTDLPLEGEALRELFDDKLHEGYYDYRAKPDGDFAFTEMMNSDGTTLHTRDGLASPGRWSIMSNVVCFRYEDLGGGCFNLYQRGNCNYAYSIESRDFVAVTVAGDEPPNCEPPVA